MLDRTVVADAAELHAVMQQFNSNSAQPLGQILCRLKLIDRQQLRACLKRQQREPGKPLGRILVDLGLIDQEQVSAALAFKCGIPRVALHDYRISEQVLRQVPVEMVLQFNIVPLHRDGRTLVVGSDEPLANHGLELVRFRSGLNVSVVALSSRDVVQLIRRYYGHLDDDSIIARTPVSFVAASATTVQSQSRALEREANRKPVVRLVNTIILQAMIRGASDINIRPQQQQIQVYYRIDGHLQFVSSLSAEQHHALVSRIKILAAMDISERRLPQDGHARMQRGNRSVDLRVSVMPTIHGESIVIRLLDREQGLRPLATLGLVQRDYRRVMRCIESRAGLFLVVGPTGSGKSTTLYAILNELRQERHHILTVEDPVEYEIPGIEQVQVAQRKGVGFANVLRHFLRHDPDVIMVGEIRDQETAEVTCRAALTGHFVISTLHTDTAPAAVMRLQDMGVAPYVISSVLQGVMAQRLVRLICPMCRETDAIDAAHRQALGIGATVLYRGRGCVHCHDSGFQGRTLVSEVCRVSPQLRQLINDGASSQQISALAASQGMQRFDHQALQLALQGRTTLEEALAIRLER